MKIAFYINITLLCTVKAKIFRKDHIGLLSPYTLKPMGFIIGISRYLLPLLAVIIFTKCMLSLVLGHPKEKTYGYIIDMADGETYALNMWETSIGRSNSCDIVIGYDTVSRYQAVISRRIDGWYIYDLNSKSGIKLNGQPTQKKATVKSGDILTFGAMQYRFVVADDPVVRVGRKKNKKGKSANTEPNNPFNSQPFGKTDYSNPYTAPNYGQPQQPNYDQTYYQNSQQEYNSQQGQQFYNENPFSDDSYNSQSNNPFADNTSFTVETPGKQENEESYTYTAVRPAIINKDTGEIFILCGNLVSIGRSRGNDIKLLSPGVSRHHADIVLYEDGWAIVDAGSSAGTLLNGVRITQPQLLFDGDVIALSDERLYYTVNPSLKN